MAQIKVEIGGRSYRMACADGEEDHLLGLAAEVDAQVEALRGSIGEVGDTRLAVMAAIVLADERNEARRRLRTAETGARSDAETSEDAVARLDAIEARAADALDDAAARIEALARQAQQTAPR